MTHRSTRAQVAHASREMAVWLGVPFALGVIAMLAATAVGLLIFDDLWMTASIGTMAYFAAALPAAKSRLHRLSELEE